jgi:hypothetical protein
MTEPGPLVLVVEDEPAMTRLLVSILSSAGYRTFTVGTGRDAADVSFATIFGPVRTGMPTVSFEAVEDPVAGYVAPAHTELAVSTA